MSQVVVPEKVSRSRFRHLKELWVQVLIAAVLGIAVGLLWPTVGAAVKPLNDWFIALVKMIVAPVIFRGGRAMRSPPWTTSAGSGRSASRR